MAQLSILNLTSFGQRPHLMFVGIEDALFAAPEVRMYLARQQCVFRNICLPGVFVSRKEEEPDNTDYHA